MLNFDFYAPARILFGKGEENRIGELLKPRARKLLLHYGGGSIKNSGLYDRITASLKNSSLDFVELGGVLPNPRLSLVHEGVDLFRREKVDLIWPSVAAAPSTPPRQSPWVFTMMVMSGICMNPVRRLPARCLLPPYSRFRRGKRI
jgi:hypothetical protein